MTPRQKALIQYHSDLAAFATNKKYPVFVILDLEDPDGFEIACQFEPNCSDRRDAIRASDTIPAYTLALSITDANRLIASGWPELRQLQPPPPKFTPVLLFSGSTCLSVLLPK